MRNYKVKYLSYMLEEKVPVYGNKEASLEISPNKSLDRGDSCNTFRFSMENHWGTHIDAPAHFFKDAKKISDYPPDSWIFNNPCVIELSLGKNRIIGLDEIVENIKEEHDCLLLKTGFGRLRGTEIYSFDNPMIRPEVGSWLRLNRPGIRAIGFDFASIGSYSDRKMARQAHRGFLDPGCEGRPVLIIEDMDLSEDLSVLKMIWVAPFLIKEIDSAPCTIFGLFKE